MLIALQHYYLQVENLNQIIMVVKIGLMIDNWIALLLLFLKIIWKLKCFLAKENYDLIKKIGFFE